MPASFSFVMILDHFHGRGYFPNLFLAVCCWQEDLMVLPVGEHLKCSSIISSFVFIHIQAALPVCGNQVKAFAGQPCSGSDHVHEFLLCQYLNTELLRLCQLASGLFPADQVICLFGDGAAGRGAEADDFGVDAVTGEVLKFPCGYDGASDTLGAFLL